MIVSQPGLVPPIEGRDFEWARTTTELAADLNLSNVMSNVLTRGLGTIVLGTIIYVETTWEFFDALNEGPGTLEIEVDNSGTAVVNWLRNTADGILFNQSYAVGERKAWQAATLLRIDAEGTLTLRMRARTLIDTNAVMIAVTTRLQTFAT